LSDLEIIDAIGGHYPNYIQGTLFISSHTNNERSLKFLKQTPENEGRTDKTQFEPQTSNIKASLLALQTEV
jgi:hypothetical protein